MNPRAWLHSDTSHDTILSTIEMPTALSTFTAITERMPGGDLLVLTFMDSEAFFLTVGRVSEFAEHPEFYGRLFTHAELNAHWQRCGSRDYGEDVVGINLPGEKIADFFLLYREVVTTQEAYLRAWLDATGWTYRGAILRPFFLIAINDRHGPAVRKHVVQHELSHALYYFDPEYREFADRIWESIAPEEKAVYAEHLSRSYTPDRYADECVAHCIAGDGSGINPPVDYDNYVRIWELYEGVVNDEMVERLLSREFPSGRQLR